MKRRSIWSALAVVLLLLPLVACPGKKEDTSNKDPQSPTAPSR
jgi:hypothetical protein